MTNKSVFSHDQLLAKELFDKIVHTGCLNNTTIKYHLSSLSTFNGDVLLVEAAPGDCLHLFLGDFAGHGFRAAIGALPVSQLFYELVGLGASAEDMVCKINEKLFLFLPKGMFLACIYIVFDQKEKFFKIFNAGMPNAYVLRWEQDESKPTLVHFPSKEIALGILPKEKFHCVFDCFFFKEGDKLLLYSDGVLERCAPNGNFLGKQGIESFLMDRKKEDLLIPLLLEKLDIFSEKSKNTDDATLVEIELTLPLLIHKK